MSRLLQSNLRKHPSPYLTDTEIKVLFSGSPDSRYSRVKRMLAQGVLLHVRRGLYCLTDEAGCRVKPHPYELAQYIYGPSYISLESALSFHKLIPESVYTITSATGKRHKEFHTSLGVFSYLHLPLENLLTGVERVNEGGGQFFIATPWKAICDLVFCYKKDWKSLEPLKADLRIEIDSLPELRDEEIQLFDEYYQSARVSRFLKGVIKDFRVEVEDER